MIKLTRLGKQNAYTCTFDDSHLEPIRAMYRQYFAPLLEAPENRHNLSGGQQIFSEFSFPPHDFFLVSFQTSPVLWISNDNLATWQIFDTFFQGIDISDDVKALVDCHENIIMYSGFLVVSNQLNEHLWHMDFHEGANAYTLITPLFDLAPNHGNLLYRDNEQVKTYPYTMNEAIIFGDTFAHSTEPYPAGNTMRVLLSMSFGTDKLEYWDILKKNINYQSRFMMLPCGHVKGTCQCVPDEEGLATLE